MRILLATPIIVLGKILAFIAGLISGRPITFDIPMTLEEAIEEGFISPEDARKIQAEIDQMNDDEDSPY